MVTWYTCSAVWLITIILFTSDAPLAVPGALCLSLYFPGGSESCVFWPSENFPARCGRIRLNIDMNTPFFFVLVSDVLQVCRCLPGFFFGPAHFLRPPYFLFIIFLGLSPLLREGKCCATSVKGMGKGKEHAWSPSVTRADESEGKGGRERECLQPEHELTDFLYSNDACKKEREREERDWERERRRRKRKRSRIRRGRRVLRKDRGPARRGKYGARA